jgi:energy-coupling factor transport system substrate-specific component
MAGWGLVGLAGAWLGVVTRRRLGRLGLAIVCAVAGLAYGALLDLSVMVTYGGEQSLDRYLALSARGIPFNLAHAIGNFVIAFAAGPALVRMISRFRTRLEFTWRPAGVLPLLLVAMLAASSLALPPRPAQAKQSALAWLVAAQNSDGGFAATPGQPSSPAMTGWAMLGLEAAGRNPLDVSSGGRTAVSYLRSQVDRLRSVGDVERTILALGGAGLDPRRFAGLDLVADLRSRRDGDGSIDGQVNLTAFYALALRAAGSDPGSLERTGRWLRRAQNSDGGWGIQPEAPSEADSTGAALQGLVAADSRGSATSDGVAWLRKAQRPGGGYALGSSGVLNSQSTAWAVQGLAAAGSSGDAIGNALSYLSRLQAGDGHYRYAPSSDQTPIWVTTQTLLAIERQPFPIPAVARAQRPSGSADRSRSQSSGQSSSASGAASSGGSRSTSGSTGTGTGTGGGGVATGGDAGANGEGAAAGPTAAAPTAAPPAADHTDPSGTDPGAIPVSVSYPDASSDDDQTSTYLLVGLAVLGAIVAGGFAWYRRRLP